MSRDINKWNKPRGLSGSRWGGPSRRPNYPPGLRGMEIGMYFKSLGAKKQKRDTVINLKIPRMVLTALDTNLKSIARIAARQNISLPQLRRSDSFKNNTKIKEIQMDDKIIKIESTSDEENTDKVIQTESSLKANNANKVIKIESKSDENNADKVIKAKSKSEKNNVDKVFKIDSSAYENYDDKVIKIKSTSDENNADRVIKIKSTSGENKDDKVIKAESSLRANNADKVIKTESSLKANNADTVIKIESTSDENNAAKDIKIKSSSDENNADKVIKIKSPSDENNADKVIKIEPKSDQMIEQNVEDYSSISCEAGPSKLPDFMAVIDAQINDYGSEPRLRNLRKLSDYKYGYDDIITGTFNDKLNECLAKGVSINMRNSDTAILNENFFADYQKMIQKIAYKNMLKFREKLPAYKKSKEVLNIIRNNQVIVISGETGCGKSTQVPQLILDEAICAKRGANVKIIVTQPRRIAASSLASRVSRERGESTGHSVGFAVRLEKVEERARGSIKFCTTGILLSELEVNQGLTEYSHIILDEVHERDVHVDLSMCMLKQVLQKRTDLKLILMSATLDAEILSGYFNNCPLMHIEGIAYPVQDIYLEDILEFTGFMLPPEKPKRSTNGQKWNKHLRRKQEAEEMEKRIKYRAEIGSWLESKKRRLSYHVYEMLQEYRIEDLQLGLIVELLIYICKGRQGAILVFLPGIGDITKLMRLMSDSSYFPRSLFEIYPLHSKLHTLEQHKIFERPRGNIRKIIIATNIAETSITIDDIVYVVDCGKIKIKGLNIEDNVSTLQTEWVAQANLRQRRGRAGRCQPGICYHLITSFRAQKIEERLLPELQRSDLLEPVLMIKKLRLGKAVEALKLVPSPPAETTIKWAVKHLQKCGALDDNETLTPLGWHLARLPVHPAAGKLLLLGALFGCLDRAASVAAVWGFKDPFLLVIGKEREMETVKQDMAQGEPSDHVAISEAILEWERRHSSARRSFAYDNFLSNSTLEMLSDMKKQLAENLRQMGFLATGDIRASWENRNANNLSLFKAIVAASLYPNIAYVKWQNINKHRKPTRFSAWSPEDGKYSIHPSSVMAGARSGTQSPFNNPGANWLVYWLKQKSSELFLLDVTLIYTLPLLFFGEFAVENDAGNPESCLLSISTIKVRCDRTSANKLFKLRSLLDKVLASRIDANMDLLHDEFEGQVIDTVIQLITAEDERTEYLGADFPDSDNSESESDKW